MPRYDYKCDACSHRFEEKQSFSSEPVAVCPECAGRASRQFVAVPVVFKGSGFYVNDYGKNGSTTKAKSNNDSSSDSDSKSESKTEKSETTTAKAETTPAASTSTSTSTSDSKAD